MRKAHCNLESFGSKTKPTDHTALTTCPKLQFTFHFLSKYTQHRLWQILFLKYLFLHKHFVFFFRRKNWECFPFLSFVVYFCSSLCQHCVRWDAGSVVFFTVCPIRLLPKGSCDMIYLPLGSYFVFCTSVLMCTCICSAYTFILTQMTR